MLEVTVYTNREEPIRMDELRDRLLAFGLPVTLLSDSPEEAATGRWFISLEPDATEEADTMLDQQMVVLDVTAEQSLVKGAATSLLFGFEGADEDDDDIQAIKNNLRLARQSFYCSVQSDRGSGMRLLQVLTLAACLDLGGGVLHDGQNEEFFSPSSLATFLRRELGDEAEPFVNALHKD